MSLAEAQQILGFDAKDKAVDGASLKEAAKRMWDLNEEENGGSPFLQAKIYWVTNRVEYAFKKGELQEGSAPVLEEEGEEGENPDDNDKSVAEEMMNDAKKDENTEQPKDS